MNKFVMLFMGIAVLAFGLLVELPYISVISCIIGMFLTVGAIVLLIDNSHNDEFKETRQVEKELHKDGETSERAVQNKEKTHV